MARSKHGTRHVRQVSASTVASHSRAKSAPGRFRQWPSQIRYLPLGTARNTCYDRRGMKGAASVNHRFLTLLSITCLVLAIAVLAPVLGGSAAPASDRTATPAQPSALTAAHHSGQTFLTWSERAELPAARYRVYRHTQTTTTKAPSARATPSSTSRNNGCCAWSTTWNATRLAHRSTPIVSTCTAISLGGARRSTTRRGVNWLSIAPNQYR